MNFNNKNDSNTTWWQLIFAIPAKVNLGNQGAQKVGIWAHGNVFCH